MFSNVCQGFLADMKQRCGMCLGQVVQAVGWAVEGCLAWQQEGLNPPGLVQQAVRGYRDEMDLLGAFIEDCCRTKKGGRASNAELRDEYRNWCDSNGEKPLGSRTLSQRLQERGFRPYRTGRERGFEGIVVTARKRTVTDDTS